MSDPKYTPARTRTAEGTAIDPEPASEGADPGRGQSQGVGSFIRRHEADEVPAPLHAPALGASNVDAFLEEWVLRHFAVSVKLHDVHRMSEGDAERQCVLDELSTVQGVLLELHDFTKAEPGVRTLMEQSHAIQNGVGALYGWLDDLLEAATLRGVSRRRPGFVDAGDDALAAILRTLERVHPDLEVLLRASTLGVDPGVAQKITLCIRQLGAAVVRVSGRVGSTIPPSWRA
jgi:hypothetical protein